MTAHDWRVSQTLVVRGGCGGVAAGQSKAAMCTSGQRMAVRYEMELEKEVDELEYEKAEFSNEYDLLLQECVSKDIMCSILRSFESLDDKTELQCLYLEKCQECEFLKNEL
ncbi:hypothetical protein Tco_0104202 [Tanacetum coccineum]